MNCLLAILCAAAMSGPAESRYDWPAPGSIAVPPPRYAGPLEYEPKVVYDEQATKTCGKLMKVERSSQIYGCAVLKGRGNCTIIVQSGMPADLEAAVLLHERGHCKGWPPSHPVN